MDNEVQESKAPRRKVPVYVKDGELWVLYPRDRTSGEFATAKLNDVFENLEVILEGNTPEFCLVDDDIGIKYENGKSATIQHLGDWIVPMDEE